MMPSLTLPPDLADVIESLRWYRANRLARRFHRLVRQGVAFSPHRPRQLIKIAHRHTTQVDGLRLLAVVLTGFHGVGRGRAMTETVTRLRLAIADVANGRESELAYADRDLLVFDSGEERLWHDGWSVPDPFGQYQAPALSSADLAAGQAALAASNAAAAAAAASRPSTSSSPGFARGTVITKSH
jgi:hypothetical protein